jgi:hypothetical protein
MDPATETITSPEAAAPAEDGWGTDYDAAMRQIGQEDEGVTDGNELPGAPEGEEADAPVAEEEVPAEEPEEVESEPEADPDGYTPPSREEFEAMQQQIELLTGMLTEGQQAQQQEQPGNEEQPDPAALQEMLQPREFQPDPQLVHSALVDGDGQALGQLLNQQAEVLTHNLRLETNQAVVNAMNYAMPVRDAMSKFYDRNPELTGMRELVGRTFWQMRAKYPQANEMQLLRYTETSLKPVVDRAKRIAKEGARKTAPTAKQNLNPPGPKGGQSPPPRPRVKQGPEEPLDAQSRIEELNAFAADTHY